MVIRSDAGKNGRSLLFLFFLFEKSRLCLRPFFTAPDLIIISSASLIVKIVYLDAVPKAVAIACNIPVMYANGLFLVTMK